MESGTFKIVQMKGILAEAKQKGDEYFVEIKTQQVVSRLENIYDAQELEKALENLEEIKGGNPLVEDTLSPLKEGERSRIAETVRQKLIPHRLRAIEEHLVIQGIEINQTFLMDLGTRIYDPIFPMEEHYPPEVLFFIKNNDKGLLSQESGLIAQLERLKELPELSWEKAAEFREKLSGWEESGTSPQDSEHNRIYYAWMSLQDIISNLAEDSAERRNREIYFFRAYKEILSNLEESKKK